MRRKQWMKIGMIICGVIIAVAVVMNLTGIFSGSPFGYANAEKYTYGDANITEPVQNLDIAWVNGKVNLVYHSENTVELRETSDRAISEDLRMRWWLDGDTLRVQYAKSGLRLNWNQEKELTVTLPESMEMNNVNITATSGDIQVALGKFASLEAGTTSGKVLAELPEKPGFTAKIGTASGKIDYSLPLSRNGDEYVCGDGSGKVEIGTTSGSIQLNAAK